MPANATLEFASSVAGATATRPRPVAAVRLPCAAAGASRCEGSRVGVSVVGGGGDGHTRARPSAHCATRQRSWRAVDALRSAFFGREEECQPRRECVDARRGERALRDSADLLIDGTRPNPLWTSRRYPPRFKLETRNNFKLVPSLRVEKQTGPKRQRTSRLCCRGCGCWQPRITQDGALLRAKVLIGQERHGDASQGTFAIQEGCFVYGQTEASAQVARSDRSAVGRQHTGAPLGDDGPRHRGHRARARVRARAGACACACARASA